MLKKLSHVRYQHPDLDEISNFLKEFGMETSKKSTDEVWFRGFGLDHYVSYACKGPRKFLGGALEVESHEDLERWET
ncbi:unnamed protein product [Clonostachys rosea]|uniref:Uncharacterized protein n=1 Tax=Bionectria ochroleuca TaxID=29856 RepID=A0ABY6U2M0_BIOOC|nr:unnamed protein product [Clonostachys rosea]